MNKNNKSRPPFSGGIPKDVSEMLLKENKNRSEETLTRVQRFEIYSLLDRIIESAHKAQQECLKEKPKMEIIYDVNTDLFDHAESLNNAIGGDDALLSYHHR